MEPRGEVSSQSLRLGTLRLGPHVAKYGEVEGIHHLVLLEWEYLYLLLYRYQTSISTCKLGQGSYHLSGECQALQEITR